MSTPPTLPSLVGDKLYLRVATAEDVAMTHHWLLQTDIQMLSCKPRPILTAAEAADQFRKRERSADEAMFLAINRENNTPVARVNYFDLNPLNGSAQVDVLVDPDQRQKGYGKESVYDLSKYLFRARGLRKVYAQLGGFNVAGMRMLESLGFKKDGTLRGHHFYKGEYHDDLVYSLMLYEFGG